MGLVTLPNGQKVAVDPLKLANGGAAIISPDPNSRDFPTTYNGQSEHCDTLAGRDGA